MRHLLHHFLFSYAILVQTVTFSERVGDIHAHSVPATPTSDPNNDFRFPLQKNAVQLNSGQNDKPPSFGTLASLFGNPNIPSKEVVEEPRSAKLRGLPKNSVPTAHPPTATGINIQKIMDIPEKEKNTKKHKPAIPDVRASSESTTKKNASVVRNPFDELSNALREKNGNLPKAHASDEPPEQPKVDSRVASGDPAWSFLKSSLLKEDNKKGVALMQQGPNEMTPSLMFESKNTNEGAMSKAVAPPLRSNAPPRTPSATSASSPPPPALNNVKGIIDEFSKILK